MQTSKLHPRFGVEVLGLQLAGVGAGRGYDEIRDLFEAHSLLLFRDQDLDDARHIELGLLFGAIEDRSEGENGPEPTMCTVSNIDDGEVVSDAGDLRVLRNIANQQWHTDSSFMPVPALANILRADLVPSSGGETEFVSTRVAWREMPAELKSRVEGRVFRHRFSHSVGKVSDELARLQQYQKWPEQRWRALWPNPQSGEDALYLASHVCGVEGMDAEAGQALVEELVEFATQPRYVYQHRWRRGDVLIWDERATMHRGRPWPYEQARRLQSICISVGAGDGLDLVRPETG